MGSLYTFDFLAVESFGRLFRRLSSLLTSNADKYFGFHMHFIVNFGEVLRQCSLSLECCFQPTTSYPRVFKFWVGIL